jgi:hypothetical protein
LEREDEIELLLSINVESIVDALSAEHLRKGSEKAEETWIMMPSMASLCSWRDHVILLLRVSSSLFVRYKLEKDTDVIQIIQETVNVEQKMTHTEFGMLGSLSLAVGSRFFTPDKTMPRQ